jgi:hypothetical protein
MVNHPNRNRGPYTAEIGGHTWSKGPVAQFPTIRECRTYAESYGTTADFCMVIDATGWIVLSYRRDTSGAGTRWYRAPV